jgi:hypothetical protein
MLRLHHLVEMMLRVDAMSRVEPQVADDVSEFGFEIVFGESLLEIASVVFPLFEERQQIFRCVAVGRRGFAGGFHVGWCCRRMDGVRGHYGHFDPWRGLKPKPNPAGQCVTDRVVRLV